MLFKKTIVFSILACTVYSACGSPVHANDGDSAMTPWTGKDLAAFNLIKESFQKMDDGQMVTFSEDLTTPSGLVRNDDDDVQAFSVNCDSEWVTKITELVIKAWDSYGEDNKADAKVCLRSLIRKIQTNCGTNLYQHISNGCYCGVFIGNKVSGLGTANGTLKDVIKRIDSRGLPKLGYVHEENMGTGDHNERMGVAINCNANENWIIDKLTAFNGNHATTGFRSSSSSQYYGYIAPPRH